MKTLKALSTLFTKKEAKIVKLRVPENRNFSTEKIFEILSDGLTLAEIALDKEWTKYLFTAPGIFLKYQNNKGIFKEAWEQAKQLPSAELLALKADLAEDFDIKNDEAEARIEQVMAVAIDGVVELQDSVGIFDKAKELGKDGLTADEFEQIGHATVSQVADIWKLIENWRAIFQNNEIDVASA